MNELAVTQYWMVGVVSMMISFGIIACIGYLTKDRDDT